MSEEEEMELSTVTWPRSQVPSKMLSDIQTRTRIQGTLEHLRLKARDPDTLKLVNNLTDLLAKMDGEMHVQGRSPPHTVTAKTGTGFFKRIRKSTLTNEPYFDSMVTVVQSPPLTIMGRSGGSIKYLDGIRASQDFDNRILQTTDQTQNQVPGDLDDYPIWIDVVPHLCLISSLILYLIGGTVIFQLLDPEIASRPFHEVLMLPFMTCANIGWGHLTPRLEGSQAFCILYGLLGVPLCFVVFANLGRMLAQKTLNGEDTVELDCDLFVHKGVYRISLDGSNETKELHLNSSRTPITVNFREDSIFPHCSGDFSFTWSLPSCGFLQNQSAQFRIRVLAVLDSPEGLPEEYNYMEEFSLFPNSSMMTIPCSLFDIIYKKYCFELVVVDDRTHRVDDWDRRCVSSEPVHKIDGSWASWGSWTSCSGSCGEGLRKRVRTCSEPPPNESGKFCSGSSIETKTCFLGNCTIESDFSFPEALISNSTQNDSCRCGCHLHHHHNGIIFASRELNCENKTLLWTIPRQESTKAQIQILKEKETHGDVLRILQGQSMEIAWSSDKSRQRNLELSLDDDVFILFEISNRKNTRFSGFYVEFKIVKDLPKLVSLSREYSAQLGLSWAFGHCGSSACQNTVVLVLVVAVVLVLMSLIAIPPLVCTYATRKYGQRRDTGSSQMSEALLASLSQRIETDMYRSNETESTGLNGNSPPLEPYSVAKRSVGIQLSVQSSPRTSRSPARNSSIISMDELEYDYYDPVVPGSLLRPYPASDIDIDRIVDRETSGWLKSGPDSEDKHHIGTQVDSV